MLPPHYHCGETAVGLDEQSGGTVMDVKRERDRKCMICRCQPPMNVVGRDQLKTASKQALGTPLSLKFILMLSSEAEFRMLLPIVE